MPQLIPHPPGELLDWPEGLQATGVLQGCTKTLQSHDNPASRSTSQVKHVRSFSYIIALNCLPIPIRSSILTA